MNQCPILFFTRGAKLPQAPQNRRNRVESDSPPHSPIARRKMSTAMPPESVKPSKDSRSGSIFSENSRTRKMIRGEGTPPKRFQRSNSRTDFLKQVAEKLADRSTTSTPVSGSESVTPAETPMLPTLSPASSVATFVFVSSSDSSGLSSDEDDYHSHRRRSYSGSGTPGSRRDRGNFFFMDLAGAQMKCCIGICARLFTVHYFSVGFSRLVAFDRTPAFLVCHG